MAAVPQAPTRRSSCSVFSPPRTLRQQSPSRIIGQRLYQPRKLSYTFVNSAKTCLSPSPAAQGSTSHAFTKNNSFFKNVTTSNGNMSSISCSNSCDDESLPAMSITASCEQNPEDREVFEVADVPLLPSITSPHFEAVYREKMRICSHVFNFNSNNVEKLGKKMKLESLIEIENFYQRKKEVKSMSAELHQITFDMIHHNIYDQDPFVLKKCKVIGMSIASNIVDPSWVHLSHIFNIFNSFFTIFPDDKNIDLNLAKKTIVLMNLPDVNVRDHLVNFLKSYIKIHEKEILDLVNFSKSVLQNVIDGVYSPYCVSPLLTFLVPIFKANKPFTSNITTIVNEAVFPLFRCKDIGLFFSPLDYFLSHVLEDERLLQSKIIDRLLKTFPTQTGSKQPMYVTALISVLKIASSRVIPNYTNKILSFLKGCIMSPNSKVAEAALKMWTGQRIANFLVQNNKLAIPELLPICIETASLHWDKQIQDLALNATSAMRRLNTQIYTNVIKSMMDNVDAKTLMTSNAHISCSISIENAALKNWASISRTAASKDETIDLNYSLQEAHRWFIKEGVAKQVQTRQFSMASFAKGPVNLPMKASTMSQPLYNFIVNEKLDL